ncbi:MAG: hypothetical protein AAFO69_02940, partial [Bacteroidota bacterium]
KNCFDHRNWSHHFRPVDFHPTKSSLSPPAQSYNQQPAAGGPAAGGPAANPAKDTTVTPVETEIDDLPF